jgi:uncharacterized membrane protein YbhN (UPF0104 family)
MSSAGRSKRSPWVYDSSGMAGSSGIAQQGLLRRVARPARWLLQLSVAFGLVALVLWRADLAALGDEYENFEPWPAVGAVLLNLPLLLVMTYRGQLTLARLGHRVVFRALLPISVLGNVAGTLTPAASGDLLRMPFFKDRHEIPYAHGVAAIFYERGYSVYVLGLSTGVAAGWSLAGVAAGLPLAALAALAGVLGPPAGAFVLQRLRPVLPGRGPEAAAASFFERARGALGRSLDSLLVLLRDPWTSATMSAVNGVVFGIVALQMWLVLLALDVDASFAEAWTAVGASMLAGIVTLLPFGLGGFDATLAAIIGASQDGFNTGAAAAVLVRGTMTLPLGLAAVAAYLYLMAGGRRRAAARESADAGVTS